ncbi:hypothetical protein PENSPDRAFT_251347 [Peniophora sp. CONT]|nr:hypothetical protein PENSPDRAFT_251347 [Peniophora sp. CONT]
MTTSGRRRLLCKLLEGAVKPEDWPSRDSASAHISLVLFKSCCVLAGANCEPDFGMRHSGELSRLDRGNRRRSSRSSLPERRGVLVPAMVCTSLREHR